MLKRTITAAAATLALAAPPAATAQSPQGDYVLAVQATPGAAQASPGQPTTRAPQQFVNIRLELTISITDQRGAAAGPAKTVSLYVVDRDNGRIRTGAAASSAARASEIITALTPVLNVDATPEILTNGRVRVSLSVEYRPGTSEADKTEAIHINERLSAVLDDGKPMVISQTPDPASDRNVKVELKATILK